MVQASSHRPICMRALVALVLSLAAPAGVAHAHHLAAAAASAPLAAPPAAVTVVEVRLSEWRVALAPDRVPAGAVRFHVTNAGQVPHALEIEGHGLERRTPEIQPGAEATLAATVGPAGSRGHEVYKTYTVYKVYCPVGKGSHRMLGMQAELRVGAAGAATGAATDAGAEMHAGAEMQDHAGAEMHDHAGAEMHEHTGADAGSAAEPRAMRVTGGGPVVQILPGPYPFADSAQAIIAARPPDQQADLTKKAHEGPYSNHVAAIAGDFELFAIDRGAEGDSVSGRARFTTADGAHWELVLDRVQTRDIPFNPRFGGVIMGLFYHGASGVHTPLVPTIKSSLALWAYGHLARNGVPVADDAMVHVMLLSRTRRTGDWALDCWDCSDRPIEELQLQVTPSPGKPALEAPGGFLFVNWEKSRGERVGPARQASRTM